MDLKTLLYPIAIRVKGIINAFLGNDYIPLQLPAVPDKEEEGKPSAYYLYYWFVDIEVFKPISIRAKQGVYIQHPTFAVLQASHTYDDYFQHCIKSPERALIRKAIKNGYTVKEINYDDYLDEIAIINTSKDQRGGREMSDDYVHPKKRDSIVKPINSYIYSYGCFSQDGSLVAYYLFEKITNFYHTVKGIGHREHLKNGIMNYLFAYSVGQLTEKQECEYIVYGMITPQGDGLDRFKRQAGCQIMNIRIKGNKEQFKVLKYFKRTYHLHGDSGLNYVIDYC